MAGITGGSPAMSTRGIFARKKNMSVLPCGSGASAREGEKEQGGAGCSLRAGRREEKGLLMGRGGSRACGREKGAS